MSVNRRRSQWKNEDAPIKISCQKAVTACYGELPGECCMSCMKRHKSRWGKHPDKDDDRRKQMRRDKLNAEST